MNDIIDDILFEEEINIVENIEKKRRQYNTRNRVQHCEHFLTMDDLEFFNRFRLSKETVMEFLPHIQNQLEHKTTRNKPITPLEQFLITLRFYATGCFYITVADFSEVHKTTARLIIKRTTEAICKMREQYIYMPRNEDERMETMLKFYKIARFPKVVGSIDGTHIRIQSPGGDNAEIFRNRKGFFSINVQVVADAQLNIRDIVVRWPGSSHDANIFDNSRIKQRFQNNDFGDSVLLGDSAYPQSKYLMTPINNPQNESENNYQQSQVRTRNVVERTFGVWKRRFNILSCGIRCDLHLAQNIVVATAILHNIASQGDLISYNVENYDVDITPIDIDNQLGNNNTRRPFIEYFNHL